jgi:pimeloyl-ACP methyl ester carboxylesterase
MSSPALNGLFLPGWGATAGLYAAGLPEGWEALELPSFRHTRGEFFVYHRWLADELGRRQAPVPLAGHSMGGVLALLAAIDRPELVQRLVLVSPAGLPLTKTMRASTATFVRQVLSGRYGPGHLGWMLGRVARAPVSALRLARAVHGLDVRPARERFDIAFRPSFTAHGHPDLLATAAVARSRRIIVRSTPDGHIGRSRSRVVRGQLIELSISATSVASSRFAAATIDLRRDRPSTPI